MQLEAAAYIFEKANGNDTAREHEKLIKKSGLSNYNASYLERSILAGLNLGLYDDLESRAVAYWALSKRFNPDLIPYFRNWLSVELNVCQAGPLFQVMIALNNLEEPVFSKNRRVYSFEEIELNVRDARRYLNKKDF